MDDKIHTLSLLNGKYTPPSLHYLIFNVFQEHFLNKHIGAKMQIDTKEKDDEFLYGIRETTGKRK